MSKHRAVCALLLVVAACRPTADASPPRADPKVAVTDERAVTGGVRASGPTEPTAEPTPDAQAAADEDEGAFDRKPPEVTLIRPGSAPRRPLRFAAVAGTTERLETEMDMTMGIGLGPTPAAPVQLPTVITPLELRVVDVDERNITCETITGRPRIAGSGSLPAEAAASLRKSLDALEGLSGWYQMSARGVVGATRIEIPPDVSDEARQTMNQVNDSLRELAVPLPAEPVGKGARWDAVNDLELSGVRLRRTAHYELIGCDEDRCQVRVSITQTPLSEEVHPPGLPPGVTARLLELGAEAGGSFELDLGHVIPTHGEIAMTIHLRFEISADGETIPMSVDMTMALRLARL